MQVIKGFRSLKLFFMRNATFTLILYFHLLREMLRVLKLLQRELYKLTWHHTQRQKCPFNKIHYFKTPHGQTTHRTEDPLDLWPNDLPGRRPPCSVARRLAERPFRSFRLAPWFLQSQPMALGVIQPRQIPARQPGSSPSPIGSRPGSSSSPTKSVVGVSSLLCDFSNHG